MEMTHNFKDSLIALSIYIGITFLIIKNWKYRNEK